MKNYFLGLCLCMLSAHSMAHLAVLDMQDSVGYLTTHSNDQVALTTPETYKNTPVDVIYLNSSADTILYPRIGFSGYSVLIYITRGALNGHSLTIDCSGEEQPISLNGVLLGSKVTLYPGDRPRLYRLVSSEDGDHYDIFEIGRSLATQVATPASGETVAADGDVSLLVVKPRQALRSLTLIFPAHPQDGDLFSFVSHQPVAALKLDGGHAKIVGGGRSPVYQRAERTTSFRYSHPEQAWYRVM